MVLSLALLAGGELRLTYYAPFAGRATADAKCAAGDPWQWGWANFPAAAGTNTATFKRPCPDRGLVRLRLQGE